MFEQLLIYLSGIDSGMEFAVFFVTACTGLAAFAIVLILFIFFLIALQG